jgi:hypothetical protein
MQLVIVLWIWDNTRITRMYVLGRQMPRPGVEAEREGVSTEGTNIVGCLYGSSKVHLTRWHRVQTLEH